MKRLKFLILMVLLNGLLISAVCQSRSDSSVIANKDLNKAAKLIEQGKVCLMEITRLQKQIDLLDKIIEKRDTLLRISEREIKIFETEIKYKDEMLKNDSLKVENLKEQIGIHEQNFKAITKSLRQQKRKTFFVGAAGVISSIGLFTLLLLK